MRNNCTAEILFGLFLIILFLPCFAEDFAGGKGTRDDPYLVATAEHLNNVRNYRQAYFKQVDDIDLSVYRQDEGWEPIGNFEKRFYGVFDGNGHTIKNLTINRPNTDYVGLFGIIDVKDKNKKAELIHITLETIQVSGRKTVGGLVGRNRSIINRCSAGGIVTAADREAGGLAGGNIGTIENSRADVAVTGGERVGGLVGYNNEGGSISRSSASGIITGRLYVGGLVGSNKNEASIEQSYAIGNVTGDKEVGGLVGTNRAAVAYCFAKGFVYGRENFGVGGLVGWNNASVSFSYYCRDCTGRADTVKGTPISHEESKTRDSFTEWNFDEIWTNIENITHPYLHWQEWILTEEQYYSFIDSYEIPFLIKEREEEIRLTMRNIGTMTWEEQKIQLQALSGQEKLVPSEYWNIGVEHAVEPGELYTFVIPVCPEESGTFNTE